MWIIRTAINRPYTFIVLAVLILLVSPVAILRTPTDIFPNINIPVIAVAFQYTGLNPEEMEGRITTVYERVLTTLVDNIEHIESTTVNGQAIVKIFLQPSASLDTANAQVTAASQTIIRLLPAGTQPPLIINYSASSVPILQLALSGNGLTEQQLNDLALNFLRTQLVTVPGACPSPKICPNPARSLSARIVHSHAGHHSESVSVRSTAGLWTSSRRCREPSHAAAAGRIQEEAETAYADAMGPAVLGRSVPGLGRLA